MQTNLPNPMQSALSRWRLGFATLLRGRAMPGGALNRLRMGTCGELGLPVLLVSGLGGRTAALGLSAVNVVAVISLAEIAPEALQQHMTWGVVLAALAIFGSGRWSVDPIFGCYIRTKPE